MVLSGRWVAGNEWWVVGGGCSVVWCGVEWSGAVCGAWCALRCVLCLACCVLRVAWCVWRVVPLCGVVWYMAVEGGACNARIGRELTRTLPHIPVHASSTPIVPSAVPATTCRSEHATARVFAAKPIAVASSTAAFELSNL